MTDFAPATGLDERELEDALEPDKDPAVDSPFIAPVAMENDADELFAGDRGVLDPEVRRVLVRVIQRRFLLANRNRADWMVLLENQQQIESRLHDLFVRLIVDHDRGVAYKEQVRSDELEVPILLRDEAYSRAETLVMVHLRTVYQRETTAGEDSARVDIEEIEQTALTYFAVADGNTARGQKTIRAAVNRLRQDGILDEESEGRYRISPLVEIVLSSERLNELKDWLEDRIMRSEAEPLDLDADESDDTDDGGDEERSNADDLLAEDAEALR